MMSNYCCSKTIAILTTLLLSLNLNLSAAGYSFWQQKTNCGSTISYESCNGISRTGIRCKKKINARDVCGHEVSNISEWYFYKSHIIGMHNTNSEFKYFIFNEYNCTIQSYKQENEYILELNTSKLNPKILTRYYNSNWGFFNPSGDFSDRIIFLFIKLPIVIITLLVFLIIAIKTKLLNRKFNIISVIILIILVTRITLDYFPQSI